ncbi:MAG: hypothetical protein Q8Q79_13860 [Sphingopyxis sp.]|nr:hypothetical protein [Sphingopyxis sp.]
MVEPNDPQEGMTFNERLFARGLFDRFDAARASRNRDALRLILTEIEIFDVEGTIDRLFDPPPSVAGDQAPPLKPGFIHDDNSPWRRP